VSQIGVAVDSAATRQLYLELMQKCLLGLIYQDPPQSSGNSEHFDLNRRLNGRDWPSQAHSMIGKLRMDNLRNAVEYVIANGIPGDFIETGVWRGGACILVRAVLAAYGVSDRIVWCADSFEGLPAPDAQKYADDAGSNLHTFSQLAIPLDEVRTNFARYDLLDGQVRFLKGWFKDTLASAPIEKLAVLRLDGDMYESTMDALTALYGKVSPGGIVIIDDYGVLPSCRKAVHDFRDANGIDDAIRTVDSTGVWWIKTK